MVAVRIVGSMFDGKLRVEKVEMVKRLIRQNNYHQYEKTHQQCIELGLNVNRPALDRFANKLELIDKAQLSKRQNALQEMDFARQQAVVDKSQLELQKRQAQVNRQAALGQTPAGFDAFDEFSSESDLTPVAPPAQTRPAKRTKSPAVLRAKKEMTYEEVKQRENEITFALGELKIRENELLQELITLSEMLQNKQIN